MFYVTILVFNLKITKQFFKIKLKLKKTFILAV